MGPCEIRCAGAPRQFGMQEPINLDLRARTVVDNLGGFHVLAYCAALLVDCLEIAFVERCESDFSYTLPVTDYYSHSAEITEHRFQNRSPNDSFLRQEGSY